MSISVNMQEVLYYFQDQPPFSAASEAPVAVSGEAGGSAGDFHQKHLHQETGPQ